MRSFRKCPRSSSDVSELLQKAMLFASRENRTSTTRAIFTSLLPDVTTTVWVTLSGLSLIALSTAEVSRAGVAAVGVSTK